MNKRISEKLRSLVEVFMDACQVWINYSNDDEFLSEIKKVQYDLNTLDMDNCSEHDIQNIQTMTMQMLDEINNSLKASGYGGLRYRGIKH